MGLEEHAAVVWHVALFITYLQHAATFTRTSMFALKHKLNQESLQTIRRHHHHHHHRQHCLYLQSASLWGINGE